MAPKRAKKGVVRKSTVLTEADGRGVYSFLLYSNIDKSNKAIFKIGQTTTSFRKRNDHYHTYVPLGVYIMCLLDRPTKLKPKNATMTSYYELVEENVFQEVKRLGGQFIWSSTRIRKDRDKNNLGRTEFVYCSDDQLIEACLESRIFCHEVCFSVSTRAHGFHSD